MQARDLVSGTLYLLRHFLRAIFCARKNQNRVGVCAFEQFDQERARQEALRRAFEASGKTVAEFAAMYGMDPRDVGRALERQAQE